MDTNNTEPLWKYEDVATYLACSWKTVRRWAGEERLPLIKIGKLNRFEPQRIREEAARGLLPYKDSVDEIHIL